MTQEELGALGIRFSGLCLIWRAAFDIAAWVLAHHVLDAAANSSSGERDAMAAIASIQSSMSMAGLVMNVTSFLAGIYCVFGGKALVGLLCRREGSGRTA
jgi:hypothetical protein